MDNIYNSSDVVIKQGLDFTFTLVKNRFGQKGMILGATEVESIFKKSDRKVIIRDHKEELISENEGKSIGGTYDFRNIASDYDTKETVYK